VKLTAPVVTAGGEEGARPLAAVWESTQASGVCVRVASLIRSMAQSSTEAWRDVRKDPSPQADDQIEQRLVAIGGQNLDKFLRFLLTKDKNVHHLSKNLTGFIHNSRCLHAHQHI
jgi:hypothetical protein